ncbi:MAG: aminotransferase class V-fold PLP-dependent enzyme [Planctomycetota bacterium]
MADSAPRRLYMDNAATSFPKPTAVAEAMKDYADRLGASAGRGAYAEAIETGQIIDRCRRDITTLIGADSPVHVIFTLNCSDALNMAIKGMLDPRPTSTQHVVCTETDHNSILRPVEALASDGVVERTHVTAGDDGIVDPDDIRKAIRHDTKLVCITHVSNVTGAVQPVREIGQICREAAVPFVVDAAQSIGHLPIDVDADCIDLLCAPGHKGLLGPLGTGFLHIRPGLEKMLRTIKEGGTGSRSEDAMQPEELPDKYEPGSHNAIGIAGLGAGVRYILERGIDEIAAHEASLVKTFVGALCSTEGVGYAGPEGVADRIGVFAVDVEGYSPHELAAVLENDYGILTRPGIHCAPFVHRSLGTVEQGGLCRLSFGPFLGNPDVKFAADALAELALESVTA